MVIITRSDELYHWGIKGMRWGIRRFQNKDGSLTPAGRKRYDQELDALSAKEKKLQEKTAKLKKKYGVSNDNTSEQETVEAKRERLLKSSDAKELYENRALLTTAELNERINRIDTEARLSSKIVQEKVKTGHEIVNEKMKKLTETVGNVSNMFRNVDSAYSTFKGSSIAKALGLDSKEPKIDLNPETVLKNIASNKYSANDYAKLSTAFQNMVNVRKNANEMSYKSPTDIKDILSNPERYSDFEVQKGKDRSNNLKQFKENMDKFEGKVDTSKDKKQAAGMSEDDVKELINQILDDRKNEG